MTDIKKIMVGLVFTPHSKGIFDYAVNLAENLNAELVITSVINSRDIDAVQKVVSLGYEVDGDHYIEEIKEERKRILKKFISESVCPQREIRLIFKIGNPVKELLKSIVEEEADMIVMGVKSQTAFEHALVGSVADKLFRRSPVAVVSYRDEEHAMKLRKKIKCNGKK